MNKTHIKILVNITVSLMAIFIIVQRVDLAKSFHALLNIDVKWFFLALALYYFEKMIIASQWIIYIQQSGFRINFFKMISIVLASNFWGSIIPTGMGADFVKVYYLNKSRLPLSDGIVVFLKTKIASIIAIFLFALLGLLLAINANVTLPANLYFLTLGVFAIILLFAYFVSKYKNIISSLFKKLFLVIGVKNISPKAATKVIESFFHKEVFIKGLIVSLTVQLLRILVSYYCSIALGINISLYYFILVIPLITLILLIPVSMWGLGIREGAYVYFFGLIGLESEQALSISLLALIILIIIQVSGGLLIVLDKVSNYKDRKGLDNGLFK